MTADARARTSLRTLLLPLAAWAAGLGGVFLPHLAAPGAVVLWAAALACVCFAARPVRVLVTMAVIAAALVVTVIAVRFPARDALLRDGAAAGGFTGVVTTKVEPAWAGAWHFEADVSGRELPVHGTVSVLFTGERPPALDLGAAVELRGAVTPTDAGARAVIDLRLARPPTVTGEATGVLLIAAHARQGLVRAAAAFPGAGGALMPGLAVGDTSAVGDDLDAAMKATGLSHLTAVSGSNCVIVVAAAFALAALCGASRAWRVVIAVVALTAFVVLVTPEASVVRAAGMSVIGLVALVTGRRSQGLAVLGTAVTVVLIADPWLAANLGFALSVAATLALIVIARPLALTLGRVMPVPLAVAISVPLAAQLACAPILILITPAISVHGVLANMIAGPAAPLATVAGMVACATAGIPILGTIVTALAWVPSQWVASTAETIATWPAVQVPWLDGLGGALALTAICAALAALLARAHGRLTRAAAIAILAVSAGIGTGGVLVRTLVVPLGTPQTWTAANCDVGQGDALVLRSGDAVMLIDTGPAPEPLSACLERLRIGYVDVLVLTHFDADHAGGTEAVEGRVGTVIHGPWTEERHGARLRALADGGAALHPARIGDTVNFPDATARVLWPPQTALPGNDASVIIEWNAPDLRLIALGDMSAEGQQALLAARTLRPPYDVVKVAHHGSADQSERLYAQLGATFGIISVGADNDYGHPRAETLQLLERHGIAVARTDRSGMVLVGVTDGALAVWTERRADGRRRRLPVGSKHDSDAAPRPRQEAGLRHPTALLARAAAGSDRANLRSRRGLRRARVRGSPQLPPRRRPDARSHRHPCRRLRRRDAPDGHVAVAVR